MKTTKTILCIDDSNTALMLLEYALNEAGFQPLIALSVEEGIQIIKKQVPDLILLDLSMPAISGYDFLKMKSELHVEKIPIIIVSAFDSPQSIAKTKELGATDFISKPLKMELVIEKIRTCLKD
jgi:putative two-component system response regulator